MDGHHQHHDSGQTNGHVSGVNGNGHVVHNGQGSIHMGSMGQGGHHNNMMMMAHGHSTFRLFTTTPMLFQAWPTSTMAGLVMAIISTSMLAFIYEGLRYYVYVHSALDKRGEKCPKNATKYKLLSRISGSLLHMLHFTIGYILMLAVMTFNVWIFVSLILGATLGYFFIRPTVEHYFKITREKRNKCGTKGRLLQNGTTNSDLVLRKYNFEASSKCGKSSGGKTNGKTTNGACRSQIMTNGVMKLKGVSRERFLLEDRVSVV
ncbi:hypothetical protein SNE40_004720 [Patella caerulea]|uniref:Copper transport protein n=1 Tax=Patella caerulea TaxID=87958 RepID=A0AAN8K3L5_PATCE